MTNLHKLSDNLGVSIDENDGNVVLYDISTYAPGLGRLAVLTPEEMVKLIKFAVGDVDHPPDCQCNDCFEQARRVGQP